MPLEEMTATALARLRLGVRVPRRPFPCATEGARQEALKHSPACRAWLGGCCNCEARREQEGEGGEHGA